MIIIAIADKSSRAVYACYSLLQRFFRQNGLQVLTCSFFLVTRLVQVIGKCRFAQKAKSCDRCKMRGWSGKRAMGFEKKFHQVARHCEWSVAVLDSLFRATYETGFQLQLQCSICNEADFSEQANACFSTVPRHRLPSECSAKFEGFCTLSKVEAVYTEWVAEFDVFSQRDACVSTRFAATSQATPAL